MSRDDVMPAYDPSSAPSHMLHIHMNSILTKIKNEERNCVAKLSHETLGVESLGHQMHNALLAKIKKKSEIANECMVVI